MRERDVRYYLDFSGHLKPMYVPELTPSNPAKYRSWASQDRINSRTKTRIKEVKRSFNTALRLAGIEGLVWHDLRATFGTRLGEAGYDAFTIAALMGHSY